MSYPTWPSWRVLQIVARGKAQLERVLRLAAPAEIDDALDRLLAEH